MPLQHEVDGFCRYALGGADKIPFVLTIFIIENDHYLTARNGLYSLMNGAERFFLIHKSGNT
jgi:hypothetical protein